MKTDHALAELFAHDPDLIKVILGLGPEGRYRMFSDVVKEVERRLDAVFIAEEENLPIVVSEFQGYDEETIYYRWLTKIGLIGTRYPRREIYGVLLFILPEHAPRPSRGIESGDRVSPSSRSSILPW